MNRNRARKVLQMLDRLNQEIDYLGNIILQNKTKPVPVPAKAKNRRSIL